MLNLYVSILLLFENLTPTAAKAEALKTLLDIAQIKKVSITGEASRVEFTTTDTRPWSVAMTSIRSGWFSNWYSSWFSNECETDSTIEVKDQTLLIHVVNAPLLSLSDCEVSKPICQRTAMSALSSTRSMLASPAIIAASASMAMRRTLHWMDMRRASMLQAMRSEPTYASTGRTTTRRSGSIPMRSMRPSASARM